MMGESAGLHLRKEGGAGIPGGSSGMASAMAVSTSTAAPSMIAVQIELQRDLGVADGAHRGHRVQAGDAGELPLERRGHRGRHGVRVAPGRLADTISVGKSTFGRSLTGSAR